MVGLVSLGALVGLTGCRENQYPRCGAFEFGDLMTEPRLVDDDANPHDCGHQRLGGSLGALEVDSTEAIDCASQALADGRAFRLELDRGISGDAESISAVLFADDDGLAMLWQDIDMDLNGTLEARVVQLDVSRLVDCRDVDAALDRYTCFNTGLGGAVVVDTCKVRHTASQ